MSRARQRNGVSIHTPRPLLSFHSDWYSENASVTCNARRAFRPTNREAIRSHQQYESTLHKFFYRLATIRRVNEGSGNMSRRTTRSVSLQRLRIVLKVACQHARLDEHTKTQWITILWLLYLLVITFSRHVAPNSVQVVSNLGSLDNIRHIVNQYPKC